MTTTRATMRQAIVTKYHGPTEYKGSRIIARAEAGSVTLSYRPEMNRNENHAAAARALADKYGWGGEWVGGAVPKSSAYVWVDAS